MRSDIVPGGVLPDYERAEHVCSHDARAPVEGLAP